MPSFVNFPAPNLPLTGAESLMIAQAQNGQLVTCTATIAEIGTGAIGGALSSPPPIGNITPNTGAFTTLNAQTMAVSGNETVDGTLNVVGSTTVNNFTVEGTFSGPVPILPAQAANTFFAGPVTDGAEPPAFRDIASADINAALTTPGPIGSGSPNTGSFTAVSASGEITANGSGTGLGVMNNATIGGTLGVTGASNLAAVNASGEIIANGSGTGLDVINNASVGGALTVSGEIAAVGSGTGLAVTNNALVGGTLTVDGASTLEGEVLATATGTGLAVTNNATIGGTLGVTGTSTLGVVNASGEITATATGIGLAVTNNATVGGTLGVTGEITASAAGTGLAVTNNATIGGTLAVTGTASVGAATTDANAPQTVQVQKNAFNYSANTTNVGNAYTASYTPAITTYTLGMVLSFSVPAANTGSSTFNAGGGILPIVGEFLNLLQGGELETNTTVTVQLASSGTVWIIQSGSFSLQVAPATASLQAPQWGQIFSGNNAVWNNETGTRTLGTTFTNSFGKPIGVSVRVTAGSAGNFASFFVNAVEIGWTTEAPLAGSSVGVFFTVPAGATYAVIATGTTLTSWFELF